MMIALACLALLAYLTLAVAVPTGPVVGAPSGARTASMLAVASCNDAGALLDRIARAADATVDGLCGDFFSVELQAHDARIAVARADRALPMACMPVCMLPIPVLRF